MRIIKTINYNYKALFLLLLIVITKLSVGANIEFIDDNTEFDSDHLLIVTTRLFDSNADPVIQETEGNKVTYLKAYYVDGNWYFDVEENLSELLQNNNSQEDYTVYLHGDSKTFFNVAHQAMDMQKLHGTNVILYSWPSKDPNMNGIRNFKNSRSIIETTAPQFIGFLEDINHIRKTDKNTIGSITLFAHSLGNYYLETIVEQGLHRQTNNKVFDNIVLNAAAVNAENHYTWVEQLEIQDRIYITSNSKDFILSGVRVFSDWGVQLGSKVKGPLAKNANYIDFTSAVGFRSPIYTTHSYYMDIIAEESNNIKDFYTKILKGEEAMLVDESSFTYNEKENVYNILFEKDEIQTTLLTSN